MSHSSGRQRALVEAMEHYDPLLAPDPAEWLAVEEGQRIALVVDYHQRARVKLPNQRLHAAIHVYWTELGRLTAEGWRRAR